MPKLRFSYLFRVILLVMLAGTVVSSCCRHSKVTMLEEIQLGATGVSTKAIVTDQQSLIDLSYDNHTGFGVYGYKTVEAKSYTYPQFNNTLVSRNTDNTSWTYLPKRYWDSNPNVIYYFAAYWPYQQGDGTISTTEADKILTINNIPNWQEEKADGKQDILVAARYGSYRDADGDPTEPFGGGYVNFSFKHILANVVVKGYYIGIKENHVNVLGMELSGTNMLTTGGNADYTLPFAGQTNIAEGFGETVTTGNGAHTLLATTSPAVTLPESSWYNDNENDPNDYESSPICSWFVVPSTGWQGLTLNVTYSLGDITPNSAPVAIQAAPLTGIALNTPVGETPNSGTTLPQYKYIITLKFNSASNGIEVESIQVADWSTVDISTGVYNW